jgi:hypothetical protein
LGDWPRRWLTGAAVAVLALRVMVGVLASWRSGPSEAAIEQALKPVSAYLFRSDGSRRFDIVKVAEPQSGWYIASIKLRDVETETARVVLHQDDPPDGPLTVTEGPGTAFRHRRIPPRILSLPVSDTP